MKNIVFTKKILLSVLVLFLVGILVYHVWVSFYAFAFADWSFAFKETLREYLHPSAWGIHGGALLWKYPLLFVYGLLGILGLDFNVVEKLLVFWPIILIAPLSSFFLVKNITNSTLSGFIGSLVFSYSTYFLSINTQGHELLTVAFAFVPFAILAFINLMESKRRIFIPIAVLLLFAIGSFALHSLYVAAGILFLYFIYHQLFIEDNWKKELSKNAQGVFIIFFLLGLLSLYWLLPVISLNSLTSNDFLRRELFGGEFYNIQNSLTFFYPFWSGKEPTWLHLQKIPMLFWLYPILAFTGFVVGKKNKKVAFFGILAVVGIFLTKQEGQPFPSVYAWLYAHMPGFNAFREAGKFDFITAISYSVLIGVFADFLWKYFKDKRLRYLVIVLIMLLPLWNTIPLLTGEIKALFVPKVVPKDFIKLKNYVVKDKEYSSILGINLNQYYNFTTINHPTLNALSYIGNFWGEDFSDITQTKGEKMIKYFDSDEGRRLLSKSSVGYIPVFIKDEATNQDIRRELGKNRQYFEKTMGEISYLKKVDIDLRNIILYKNTDFKPHLYLTTGKESFNKDYPYKKLEFQMVNASEYHIVFKNLSEPIYLNFTELYHPDWKIHVGKFRWYDVMFRKGYFLTDNIHFKNAFEFNSFLIDPNMICKLNTVSKCKVNKDGSVDLETTLYFRPQSYLYLGIIISGTTLIVIIIGFFYLLRKEKHEK